jgi:hypothetical protein
VDCFVREPLRNNNDVKKRRLIPIVCSNYLAELSFYSIADRCNPGFSAYQHGESAVRSAIRPVENRKLGTTPFTAGMSDKRNLWSLRQAGPFRKSPAKAHYLYVVSETERILRPFFRRRFMTFRPPLVSILFLNPCVLTLLRFDG